MNRRGFLSLLGGAAVAPLLPDAELWKPERAIFLPPTGGWLRGNSLLSVNLFTKEVLRVLHHEMQIVSLVSRQYDNAFASKLPAMKVGDTVRIRIPTRYGALA
jgi:hypothetical protein